MKKFRDAHLSRTMLKTRIETSAIPITVIDGSAGTGKTELLRDLARTMGLPLWTGESTPDKPALWDVPAVPITGPLPEHFGRLVIAKRPNTAVPGLARAEIYGRVDRIGDQDLLFDRDTLIADLGMADEEADEIVRLTGGWPCLLPSALDRRRREAAMTGFLQGDVLRPFATARLVALDALLSGRPVSLADVSGLPFFDPDDSAISTLPAPLAACAGPLRCAIAALLAERSRDPVLARAVGVARAAHGSVPEAIAIFQSIGAWTAALDTLRQSGGPFFIHRYGAEAFSRMLAGFPPEMRASEELLVLSRAIQAIKGGEVALSLRILIDRYGPEVSHTRDVVGNRARYSLDLRFFRLLLQTWEDYDTDPQLIDEAYRLLVDLPAEDDLRRGSFYNAMLDLYIRERRFAEADHTAVLAAAHYTRANVPNLAFYIDLHRGIIQLLLGNPAEAHKRAAEAQAQLATIPFESPGDVRLLTLLTACIAYETGTPEPLSRFLSLDLDKLVQGEIWPTLVELVLTYGSQSLGEHVSMMSARGFLDRWRVRQERSAQFSRLISIREIVVLQNGHRWQEAMVHATALDGRITRSWVEGSGDHLEGLQSRDEIGLALVWLRHMARTTPTQPGLDGLLTGMLANPHLTGRQRIGAEIWRAHVLRRQNRLTEAETMLRATLSTVVQTNSIAGLGEERAFLAELTATRRLRDSLERNEAWRRLLRQVQDTGPGRSRKGHAMGLTRQELRVLHALTEGATNKAIANLMALSEATVKFHLSNLYRKLGCDRRRDAVKAAQALGVVT